MTKRVCTVDGCGRSVRSRGRCVLHFFDALTPEERQQRIEKAHINFWAKVDMSSDCWEWTGALYGNGYGAFRGPDGRVTVAHRFAFAETFGPVDSEISIDHRCGNTRCVRPSHLRSATCKQNMEHRITLNRNNRSGYRGVYFADGAWNVMVRHNYKAHYLRGFRTPEEANKAAVALRNELFSYNDRDRSTTATAA